MTNIFIASTIGEDMTVEQGGKQRFGVLAHGYQPPRRFNVDVTTAHGSYNASYSVVPEINVQITEQVYRPILAEVEAIPSGLVTSIYAPLRSDIKRTNPSLFAKIQEAVAHTPDKEYCILGDPLVHNILPLLPSDDQIMLLEAGLIAFQNDFGFTPKGLWLPETAVSKEVLKNAARVGYEFVPLRDNQVKNIPEGVQLDANHNVCFVDVGEAKDIAVLLGNSGLSGFVSYALWSTYNAEEFMNGRKNGEQAHGWNSFMMMDLERFGHHQVGADAFLKSILAIQENYGYIPLNMKEVLKEFQQSGGKTFVDVVDNSSWSCPHDLGRWTGRCNCDNPTESALKTKQQLFGELQGMNTLLNYALDALKPNWRKEFVHVFTSLSDDIFTGENFGPTLFAQVLNRGGDEETARLYLAKIEAMVGMTSCGWFFGGDDGVERIIPTSMSKGLQDLLVPELEH
ncbi:MAG: hypothetical protein NTV98_05065 [Candidatus Roizmanbacteria bacterium]|nr:hypothetical protein [Candidatus Roizmanbacteria bacterium]